MSAWSRFQSSRVSASRSNSSLAPRSLAPRHAAQIGSPSATTTRTSSSAFTSGRNWASNFSLNPGISAHPPVRTMLPYNIPRRSLFASFTACVVSSAIPAWSNPMSVG
eukprot:10816-Pelagococcus_subviridis.AAC.2